MVIRFFESMYKNIIYSIYFLYFCAIIYYSRKLYNIQYSKRTHSVILLIKILIFFEPHDFYNKHNCQPYLSKEEIIKQEEKSPSICPLKMKKLEKENIVKKN